MSKPDLKIRPLKVSGATLYTESRGVSGPLLLLIAGGPADAGVFADLAQALSDRYHVVSYDPRGNSRSVFDDADPDDLDLRTMGDDAAVVIAAYTDQPAFVFGNSGGAQVALNLTARYPHLVRKLVAHEPPCLQLLADHENLSAQMQAVVEAYRAGGVKAAMPLFTQFTQAGSPERASDPDAAATAARVRANLDYFLGHAAQAISGYRPEIERLRHAKTPIVVGVGEASENQLAHRAALALAQALPAPVTAFPGGHGGFATFPTDFANRLHQALNA